MNQRIAGRPATVTRTGARHTAAIARRIRVARLLQGLSQTELGHRIGVTYQQIQKYETAVNAVTAGALLEIAEALQLPVNYFYDDCTSEPLTGTSAERPLVTEDSARLAGRITGLPIVVRRGIEGVVRELVQAGSSGGTTESLSRTASSPMTMAAE